jgi:hypothetical protein
MSLGAAYLDGLFLLAICWRRGWESNATWVLEPLILRDLRIHRINKNSRFSRCGNKIGIKNLCVDDLGMF